jgi:TolA-binding protein
MRRLSSSFDASVNAFREMTAEFAEGAATRARVLGRAEHEARRRDLTRRHATPLAIGLVILLSGAALAAANIRFGAPPPAKIADAPEATARASHAHAVASRPTRIVPALRPEDAPPSQPDRAAGERLAYERAHRDHFFRDAPAAALAAWDAYLAAYPHGTFAPEARYNRALCLVKLERFAAAAEALRPFAGGRLGGYRRHESCQLLHWLSEQDARVPVEPSCDAPM